MKLTRNHKFTSLLKWVSLETHIIPSISATQNPRCFATQAEVSSKKSNAKRVKITRTVRKMAEEAMLDYFYSTRGLQYTVAESMSKNSPIFMKKLLKEVDCFVASEINQSITRHLRYHPVNEFEPFLESSGLKPSEYSYLVPSDKLFLNDDGLLLKNHHFLCCSGIDSKKIGKIFKEAREVFEYETEVLASKIKAYEDLGLSRVVLSKLIVCSPNILIGDVNVCLAKVLEMLKAMGCDLDWVMNNLSEEGAYEWSSVYRVLSLLREICFDEDELCGLIRKHPRLIFEDSGKWTMILAGFETKLGLSRSELCWLLQNIPQIQIEKCVSNLRHCFLFLKEIEMEDKEILKIFRSHSWWLGSCMLKKTSTLIVSLNAQKGRLRQVVNENPEEMKKWTLGSKTQPLRGRRDFTKWKTMKIQFLINLGYKENSKEMEIAFKSFHGSGSDLQERFNFLVSLGLNEKVVKDMVKASPGILRQSSDVLETKVNYLRHELSYPLSTLVAFPSCLILPLAGMKLRFAMRTQNGIRITPTIRKMAEEALLDYFYSTRGLQYTVAESMSKNSPIFIDILLKKVDSVVASDIGRYLQCHPVNEFEVFLESSGLKPTEYSHLVPSDKLFLNDDGFLLENHHVLCSCGIDCKKIGKVFKEAREVFGYETGVLAAKIKAYEDLGLSRLVLSKLIVFRPSILIGDVNVDLAKVLEMLNAMGCDLDWVMKNLSEEGSYDWSSVYRVLSLLREICFDEDELCGLIRKHPRLIFEDSGKWTMILAGFETKLGLSRSELCWLLQNIPQIQVEKCVSNLRHCFLFPKEIEMEDDEILKIFRSHSWWLGSCMLKKTSSLIVSLKATKRLLRQFVQENPEEMKKWIMGLRVQPIGRRDFTKWKSMKIQFLNDLGYKENSKEMEIAFKSFHDLQERFNFLVSLGLNEKVVKDMVTTSPGILSQATDVLETKFNYLVNELDYPLSSLLAFPSSLKFPLEKMKLRFAMYSWLKARGKVNPNLAISTILACSDKLFVKRYVNRHQNGPKHWDDMKKELLCE